MGWYFEQIVDNDVHKTDRESSSTEVEEEKKEERTLQIILYHFPHPIMISIARLILRRDRNDRRTLIRSDPSALARSGKLNRPSMEQQHRNPATTSFFTLCLRTHKVS